MRTIKSDIRTQQPVEWLISSTPVAYPDALEVMERRAERIRQGEARELIWLLEHPALYTAGTGARETDLIEPSLLPVYKTGRGGKFTYHGPGQRIAYMMLDLKRRGADVRSCVAALEAWIIAALDQFNVRGETRPDRVGVWVRSPYRGSDVEDKIAAIGLRISRWVTTHGISINVGPDLRHYRGIVPCGISGHGVTSLEDLGLPVTMIDLDVALRATFPAIFGPILRIDSSSCPELNLTQPLSTR